MVYLSFWGPGARGRNASVSQVSDVCCSNAVKSLCSASRFCDGSCSGDLLHLCAMKFIGSPSNE